MGLGGLWLPGRRPWLVERPLPWQGSRVQFRQACGLCLHPRTCMSLRNLDLLGWGLCVYCLKATLPQFIAYPTYVHTLMWLLYILMFCCRVALILEGFDI